MWLHLVSVSKNIHEYISPKLCLTPEIKSKYFRTDECVGIGQTTVSLGVKYSATGTSNKSRWKLNKADWGLFKTLCEKNINILSLQDDISTLSINFTNQLMKICEIL